MCHSSQISGHEMTQRYFAVRRGGDGARLLRACDINYLMTLPKNHVYYCNIVFSLFKKEVSVL